MKHQLQDAGVQKHTLEPESCGNYNNLEDIDGFQREPLLHWFHLLTKAIKVKETGINLVLNTFLLILQSMVNFHISMGKELHVPFVVWITIMFLDVGREWPHTGSRRRKRSKQPKVHWTRQIMLSRGCTCSALTAISKGILLQIVGH